MNWIGGKKGGERRKERNRSNKPQPLDSSVFLSGHWETFLIGAKTIDVNPAGRDELYGLFTGVFYYSKGGGTGGVWSSPSSSTRFN